MYWNVKYKIDEKEQHIVVCDACLLEYELTTPEISIIEKSPISPEDMDYDEINCMECYCDI